MIKIGFDARMVRHSGIGTYIRGILNILLQNENFDFTLFGNLDKITDYSTTKVVADYPIYSLREQFLFPHLLKQAQLDLLHVPHYNAPLAYKGKLIVTVHDLIHLKFPPSRIAYVYARLMLGMVCRKAKMIIAVSQNTKKDIVELLGIDDKKIRVIHPAVGNEFFSTETTSENSLTPNSRKVNNPPSFPPYDKGGYRGGNLECSARIDNLESSTLEKIGSDYILYVGNIKPTKNVKMLMQSFILAKKKIPDLRLVMVGKNFMPEFTKQFVDTPAIQFLGECPTDLLIQLYRRARLFVFPSLYEGFGLPPLEAMASGVPVICSNAASLPEVVGDAAMLVDPEDSLQLSETICDLWGSDAKRKTLSAKGLERAKKFSWQKCAEEVAKVYEECI